MPLLLSELKQSGGRGADDGEGDVELVEGDPSERFLKDLCSVLTHRLDDCWHGACHTVIYNTPDVECFQP